LKEQRYNDSAPTLEIRKIDDCEKKNNDDSDDSDSNEEEELVHMSSKTDVTYADLESAAKFLVTGSPFNLYKKNLDDFLNVKTQQSTLQATDITQAKQSYSPSSHPIPITMDMVSTLCRFLLRAFVAAAEVLGLYEEPLQPDFIRLKWFCVRQLLYSWRYGWVNI
jgi:hypothetical protein